MFELYGLRDFVFNNRTEIFHWNLPSSADSEFCTKYKMTLMAQKSEIVLCCSASPAPQQTKTASPEKLNAAVAFSHTNRIDLK